MVAAVAMQCMHLPNGGIQWLLLKPRSALLHCTAASAWQTKLPVFDLYFMLSSILLLPIAIAKRPCYGPYNIKPSYIIVYLYVISLFVCYGRPRMMMDAVSAAIFDSGRAICQKHK